MAGSQPVPERILILGGTAEARRLAAELLGRGHDVVTSLAGVTRETAAQAGPVRRGGFGGTAGLVSYLRREGITLLLDATHPFAQHISAHAHEASLACGVPQARLERPAWTKPGDGVWQDVTSLADALAQIGKGSRVLVTTGRKELQRLRQYPSLTGLVRCIEAPEVELPRGWELMLERPPFTLAFETDLMRRSRISHLVCKNAGGQEMLAKVTAANQLGIPVLMIARPLKPACRVYPTVESLAEAVGGLTLSG
jgi:precorrin-6A/cobalt-precorrin-6A reductase